MEVPPWLVRCCARRRDMVATQCLSSRPPFVFAGSRTAAVPASFRASLKPFACLQRADVHPNGLCGSTNPCVGYTTAIPCDLRLTSTFLSRQNHVQTLSTGSLGAPIQMGGMTKRSQSGRRAPMPCWSFRVTEDGPWGGYFHPHKPDGLRIVCVTIASAMWRVPAARLLLHQQQIACCGPAEVARLIALAG